VRVSYLEIYNEEVRDLLSKNQSIRLEIKERPDVGVFVKDLSTYVVNNAEDMERIMLMGNKNSTSHLLIIMILFDQFIIYFKFVGSVGATQMNIHSSRSHAIFTVAVECSEKEVDGHTHLHVGRLNLVLNLPFVFVGNYFIEILDINGRLIWLEANAKTKVVRQDCDYVKPQK